MIAGFTQTVRAALIDRWNEDLRQGCILTLCLTALLSLWFIANQVLRGENYSPFVIKLSGFDDSSVELPEIEYESPYGSKGTLQYEPETGLYRTENFSQPIAKLSIRCPKNTDIERIGAVLWFVRHDIVEQGVVLYRGGRSARFVADSPESLNSELVEFTMEFAPLSGSLFRRFDRAMNWRGDLALLLSGISRSLLIALGFVLCGLSAISMASFAVRVRGESGVTRASDRGCAFRNVLVWCALIATLSGILFWRDPDVFLLPAMEVEDGTSIFAHYYVERDFSEVFRFKAGYIPLIPNVLGYISARVPCQLVPYYMSLISLGVCVVVYSFGMRECCARFFPGKLSAGLTCVLVCLAPYGSFHIHASVDYMIWNLLALLVLICIADPECTGWGRLPLTCLMSMLAWSHPLAVSILPIMLLKWWLKRSLRSHLVFACGMVCLYYCFGVEHRQGIAGIPAFDRVQEYIVMAAASTDLCISAGLRAVLGPVIYSELARREFAWLATVGAGLFVSGGVVHVWRKGTPARVDLLLIVVFLWVVTFCSVIGRGLETISDFGHQPRYIYVQSMFLVGCTSACAFWMVCGVFDRFTQVESLVPGLRTLGPGALLLVWYCVANQQIGYLFPGNARSGTYSYAHPGNGRIMQDFMRDLAILEKDSRLNGEFLIEAVKVNDWKVVIDTRKNVGAQTP